MSDLHKILPRKYHKYLVSGTRISDVVEMVIVDQDMCITELRGLLRAAASLLIQGKKQFAPNTTNSFVDDFLNKPEIQKLLKGGNDECNR